MADGKDLRSEKLKDRKRELRRLLKVVSASRMRYADHVEKYGTALFQRVCEMDLEGIVAKRRHSAYRPDSTRAAWYKIKNPNYSQTIGRDDLVERRYEDKGAPEIGWEVGDRACAAAAG